jgi:hypothetical protein
MLGMQISKSSRHQKIVGCYGEHLVCNWLSRSGFEAFIVDHTGIDIVAYNKRMKQRLGISVKARTRFPGTEVESVYLFRRPEDRNHLLAACEFFDCEPWVAVYVESESVGDLFLTSLDVYDRSYHRTGAATQGWGMTTGYLSRYAADSEVKHIHVGFSVKNWWPEARETGV